MRHSIAKGVAAPRDGSTVNPPVAPDDGAGRWFDEAGLARLEGALCGLRRVEVALTEVCNLACDYCDVAHNLVKPLARQMEPDLLERIAVFAAEHAAATGVEVVLTGGEPLSRWPVVVEAVETFSGVVGSAGRGLRVATNGTLLAAERSAWLADRGVAVTVGLDGGRDAHDGHRTNKAGSGSWQRAVDGIRTLVDAGVRPDVSMVVTPEHLGAAMDGIDWICDAFSPGTVDLSVPAARTLGEPVARPEPEVWADLLLAVDRRWAGCGTRIRAVQEVRDAIRSGIPLLHSDDGAWGGSVCVDPRGRAGPSHPLLSAGIGGVPLASVDLSSGPFQAWRDRSPARNSGCTDCPARGLCGNAPMYVSLTVGGCPSALDPWHCRMQRRLVLQVTGQQ